jgi:hypothetical protein
VFDRLSRDVEKRLKTKDRESNMQFTYRDNVVVKKDVFVEYDYFGSLRSDRPGEKDERARQFSPANRRRQEELQVLQSHSRMKATIRNDSIP